MRFALVLAALAPMAVLCASAATAGMSPEPIAVLLGLNKITARVSRFDAPVGQAVKFGTLSIVVRDCEKSAPVDRPENAAFIQIYETQPGEEQRRLFSGWMFSSSPALSALENPVYDVSVLECKGTTPTPTPPPPPAPTSTGRSRGKTAR